MDRKNIVALATMVGIVLYPTDAGVPKKPQVVIDRINASVKDILTGAGIIDTHQPVRSISSSFMAKGMLQAGMYVKQNFGLVESGEVYERVQKIFKNLVGNLGKIQEFRGVITDISLEVFIAEQNNSLYGLYLGSGKLMISGSLINLNDLTDDEIAGVLAHEIGHSLLYRLPVGENIYKIIPGLIEIREKAVTFYSSESESDLLGMILTFVSGYYPSGIYTAMLKSDMYKEKIKDGTAKTDFRIRNMLQLLEYLSRVKK